MQYTCSFLEDVSSWKWLLEKKNVLSVRWVDLHHNNKGKNRPTGPDFTVLKQRTWLWFCFLRGNHLFTTVQE